MNLWEFLSRAKYMQMRGNFQWGYVPSDGAYDCRNCSDSHLAVARISQLYAFLPCLAQASDCVNLLIILVRDAYNVISEIMLIDISWCLIGHFS